MHGSFRPIAVLSLCLAAAPALSQGNQPLLDLKSGPQAPAAGAGAAALALAGQLEEQATALESKAGVHERAQAAVRRLAAALLSTGEGMGARGSERIVLGRTLARGLGEIDTFITGARGTAEAELTLATDDLRAGTAALASADADAARLVRDAVAALAQMQAGAPGGSPRPIREWTKVQGLSPATAQALERAESVLSEAEGFAAYAASAGRLRARLQEAGVAAAATPLWLPAGARQAFEQRTGAAAAALVEPASRPAGGAGLERAARLARLIALADRLDDSPAGKKVKAAVAALAGAEPTEIDSAPLDAGERILTLATERARLPDEKTIARPARLAWRTFLVQARQTEGKLLPQIETVLSRPEAMSDPAVLAAISAHRQVLDDLRLVERLSAAIAPSGQEQEPQVGERWRRVGDRILKLSQDLAKPAERESALTALREMATQIVRFAAMPGEDELRAGASGPAAGTWARLTGGKGAAIQSELSDRRSSWIQGWDSKGFAGAPGDAARLEAMRGLLLLLRDAVAADPTGEPYARLNATTAWELSARSLGALAEGLAEQCAAASSAMADGDAEKCAALVAEARDTYAPVLLAGRLASMEKGPVSRPVLVELCDDDSARDPAATAAALETSRYADEASAGAPEARTYLAARAKDALGAMTERP